MGKLYNRVKVAVSGTPGTGAITLGSAASGYQSFSQAGVANNDVVSYVIEDGNNYEFGQGTYSTTGPTLTRTTIEGSYNGSTYGTSAISVTSSATVMISALTSDLLTTAAAVTVAQGGTGVTTLTGVLRGNGTSAFTAATAGTDFVAPNGAAGAITATGFKETRTTPSISSGTLTLNCSAGNVFAVSLNANITTLSFSNVPAAGTAFGLTLALTADGTARTVTWGSAVKWPGGTAPTLTSTSGKVDVFVLSTWDGGSNWYAVVGGQNL